jgi:hypothetical protein
MRRSGGRRRPANTLTACASKSAWSRMLCAAAAACSTSAAFCWVTPSIETMA